MFSRFHPGATKCLGRKLHEPLIELVNRGRDVALPEVWLVGIDATRHDSKSSRRGELAYLCQPGVLHPNSPTVTPAATSRAQQSRAAVSRFGDRSPRSIMATAVEVRPAMSANSCWVSPSASRRCRNPIGKFSCR